MIDSHRGRTDNVTKQYKVCALIWTYNPDMRLLRKVVEAALKNVDYVLIVDNCSKNRDTIDKLKSERLKVIHLPTNLGVEALNIGLNIIISKNLCEWILILDDDTLIIEATAVNEVLRRYELLPEKLKRKIAVISLSDLESIPLTLKYKLKNVQRDLLLVHYDAVIFSGALIRTEVITKHNIRIEKELFIDHADTDFFTRIRKYGYLTLIYTKRLLQHRLGLPLANSIKLGFYEIKSSTSPQRFYYLVRNATYLLIRKRISPLQWLLSILRFGIPLIVHDPKITVEALLLGFVHGVIGRLGVYHYG